METYIPIRASPKTFSPDSLWISTSAARPPHRNHTTSFMRWRMEKKTCRKCCACRERNQSLSLSLELSEVEKLGFTTTKALGSQKEEDDIMQKLLT
ncbi:GNAT family N-acetyltransferase [Sesbania bispinosa]|nr:GNAT family N-acetyltransferase [Sesbania bispinosa]